MKNKINLKIIFLFKIFIIYLFLLTKSYSDNLKIKDDWIFIGKNVAPIKIKIFSSFTCPHCANFHMDVVPKIKKNYVDSGKVQLIFLDFPLDQAAFNASKLLHCTDKSKQMNFMNLIYENQIKWANGSNINEINENLKEIVKNLGIDSIKFDQCLINESISDKILNGRIDSHQKYNINSTPTIVINEKKLEGGSDFKNIKEKIEKLI